MSTQRREIAVQALKELWQELKFEGDPLIFISPIGNYLKLQLMLNVLQCLEK